MVIDIVLGYAVGKGGLENVIKLIDNELERRGHLVRIFQMAPPENQEWADSISKIYYYGDKESIYAPLDENRIDRLSSRYEQLTRLLGYPDVIFATHTPVISWLCRMAVNKMYSTRKPVILSWLHGPPEVFGGEKYLDLCDAHLAISKSIAERIHLYTNSNKIHYIGNTIDFKINHLIKRTKQKFRFIYIGRIENKQKRLDVLVHALNQLNGEWILDVIGDGPDLEEMKQTSKSLGLQAHIKWHGWKENPWDVISETSLLLLSSDFEGFALILIEALARGVPVISSTWDGADEIVKNNYNGWLFPCGDSKKLHEILEDVISGSKILPTEKDCSQSVEPYRTNYVVDRIEFVVNQTLQKCE